MKPKAVTLILVASLILGLVVRLKDIKAPLADWHSFRQADTASVAREYVKNGIDLLHPRYHDLSDIASSKPNPQGYRMVEFPLVSGLVAWIYQMIPGIDSFELHVVYRFINIIFSLLSAYLLYLIIRKLESSFTGVIAAAAFLFLPYSIYYSRVILPEIPMVTLSLAAIHFCLRFIKSKNIFDALFLVLTASLALLLKPMAIFILLPLIPFVLSQLGKKVISISWLLIPILSIIPLYLWRRWIQNFPEGIPVSYWLYNSNWKPNYPEGIPWYAWIYNPYGIRFKGAFFYWIFADRIGRLILGYWGAILLGIGFLAQKKTNLISWWVVSTLAYLFIFATGNVQHDYYQIPIIPIISVLIAYGIQYVRHLPLSFFKRYALISLSVLATITFSWYHIRAYYSINNPDIITAGKAVDALTPPDAIVIASYMGDTAFLYQTNRRGWPIGYHVEDKIKEGATYYVSTSLDDETRQLQTIYPTVASTSAYTIIHLVK